MSLIVGCQEVSSEEKFYKDADKYWKSIPADLNGMLGGYSHISSLDISGSKKFLKEFLNSKEKKLNTNRALDCGAGIGRISKHFLLHTFKTVDLLEQNEKFLIEARPYLGPALSSRIGNFICAGLQDVSLDSEQYDLIWVQWVTGHLTDLHFVEFLKKCQRSLTQNGLIIVKDNVSSGAVELDRVDSSVARTYNQLKAIFMEADLKVVKEENQTNFPVELYKVYMFALR